MYSVEAIKNYILFLKNQCSLSITLHPMKNENLIMPSELMMFNIHDNSHCVYVKTFPEANRHCVKNQHKVFEKCKNEAFCGTCYAGVREFIYPIMKNGETVGFISVSGYKNENGESYLKKIAEKFNIPIENLKKSYKNLNDSFPEKKEIDVLIFPLLSMLELSYLKAENINESGDEIIIRYVRKHRCEDITIDTLCRKFSCSQSYISRLFKKHTGEGFREYLTKLRLNDAKMLLMHSTLSITEIAFSVGFCDSNYFSGVFKKNIGIPPRAYRKKYED